MYAKALVLSDDGKHTHTQTHTHTHALTHSLTHPLTHSLEELDVSWCRGISDEGLGHLVDNAYNLKALCLRGCVQITEIFLNGHSNPEVCVSVKRGLGCLQKRPISSEKRPTIVLRPAIVLAYLRDAQLIPTQLSILNSILN